jgi:hypothetical protein
LNNEKEKLLDKIDEIRELTDLSLDLPEEEATPLKKGIIANTPSD